MCALHTGQKPPANLRQFQIELRPAEARPMLSCHITDFDIGQTKEPLTTGSFSLLSPSSLDAQFCLLPSL